MPVMFLLFFDTKKGLRKISLLPIFFPSGFVCMSVKIKQNEHNGPIGIFVNAIMEEKEIKTL